MKPEKDGSKKNADSESVCNCSAGLRDVLTALQYGEGWEYVQYCLVHADNPGVWQYLAEVFGGDIADETRPCRRNAVIQMNGQQAPEKPSITGSTSPVQDISLDAGRP